MLEPGQILDGKYRIVRLLGSGGMGSVYEGENARIHRRVAIKVLHAHVAAKADVAARFEREAQAAGRIGSEHIVEVLDLGALEGGERYMIMELLEGEDLGSRIKRRKRLEPREAGPLMVQLLEGLAAAHDAGIIHRDLKPDNVFLTQSRGQELVKILDFGVSKFSALDRESMSMTSTGAVMGTPYYMSPEQARGAKIDPRSDVYSVGVVMYQAVTGRVPFDAETFNELVFKIALEAPPPVETLVANVEPGFAAILNRAMARDPDQRFQSAREFQQALVQWLSASPPATLAGGYQAPHAYQPQRSSNPTPIHAPFAATPTPGYAPPAPGPQTPYPATTPQQAYFQATPAPFQATPVPDAQHPPHSAQFGASQVGLAISGSQSSARGGAIAVLVISAALVVGGGLGFYFFVLRGAPSETTAVASPSASVDTPAAAPPEPASLPTPAAEPTASAPEPSKVEPSEEPEPQAPSGTTAKPKTPTGKPTAKPTTTTPTPAATPTGRAIGGDL